VIEVAPLTVKAAAAVLPNSTVEAPVRFGIERGAPRGGPSAGDVLRVARVSM